MDIMPSSILDDMNGLLEKGTLTSDGIAALQDKYGFIYSQLLELTIKDATVPVAALVFPVPKGRHLEDFVDDYARNCDVLSLDRPDGEDGYLITDDRGPVLLLVYEKGRLQVGIPFTVTGDHLDDVDRVLKYAGSGAYGKGAAKNPDAVGDFLDRLDLRGI